MKTLDHRSRDMLNFDVLEKSLAIVFPPHFVYEFSRKMSYVIFINWPNFIVWLSLVSEILRNMCNAIVFFLGFGVMNFFSLIRSFFYLTKYFNNLRTKRAFKMKQKAFFIIFKGRSVAKNCPRHKSVPLTWWSRNTHWLSLCFLTMVMSLLRYLGTARYILVESWRKWCYLWCYIWCFI